MINVNIAESKNGRNSEKITLLYGLYNGTRMLIGAVNVLFLLSRGVRLNEIAQLQMIYSVAVFVFEVPTGIIADVISRKISVLLSCALLVIYYPLIYFSAPKLTLLSIAQILYGLALCLASGAFEAWQVDIIKIEHPNNNDKVNYYGHLKHEMNAFVTMFSGTLGSILVFINSTASYATLYNLCAVSMMFILLGFSTIPSFTEKKTFAKKNEINTLTKYVEQLKNALDNIVNKNDSLFYIVCSSLLCCTYQIVYYYWQPLFKIYSVTSKGMDFFNNNTELLVGTTFFLYCFSRYLCNRYVRKKIVGKINPFGIAIGAIGVAALFMIILTSASNTYIWVSIVSFAILQGMTMVAESEFDSQYIKVINKNDISSVMSFMSAFRSVLSSIVLFIISISITSNNMISFYRYTIIAYMIIIVSLINWKKRFGGKNDQLISTN